MRTTTSWMTLAALVVLLPTAGWAQSYKDKAHADLAQALSGAKISLERGLTASVKEGKPISAKYELDDGKLQLSVYTMKGDRFSEVVVDHTTGKVVKAEPITHGEDLTAAKAQREALAHAKRTFTTAVARAAERNKGYRLVSAIPTVKDGHPVVEVELVKGKEWKTVSEKLD